MSDSQQTNPASPVDSTTPAPDQSPSQVSSDNRPDSIASADFPQISADLVQPSTDSSPPTDSSDNQPVTAISADSTQAPSESNRPDSSDSADSPQVPADSTSQPNLPDASLPAQAGSLANDALINQSPPPTPPEEPVSTVSADLPVVVSAKAEAEMEMVSPPATVSPTEPPAEEVSPAPVPVETFTPDQTPISTSPITSPPDLSTPSDLSLSADEAGNPPPINVSPPDNQAPQVQPDVPSGIPTINPSPPATQSAEIKPEPLQSPTVPSTPPENISSSPSTVSFGDLLLGNDTPAPLSSISPSSDLSSLSLSRAEPRDNPSNLSPQPVIDQTQEPVSPSSTPTTSFGDLIRDIKPEESVIQPPPITPNIPPVSSSSNPPPKTSNPQPILSPSPISDIQDKLVLLRQQAKEKKAQKKQAILRKIIDLTKTKGRLNNQEAQKILHLPQSTLTDYFKELVSSGILSKEGKGKATYYHL